MKIFPPRLKRFSPTWTGCLSSTSWSTSIVAITQFLVQNTMRRLPLKVRPSFNYQFAIFQEQDPENILAPNTFSFLAQFLIKLKKNNQSNPRLFDLDSTPSIKGVKIVRQGTFNPKAKPFHPPITPGNGPQQPYTMCTIKGYQASHFSISMRCGAGKLSSPDILKIIS